MRFNIRWLEAIELPRSHASSQHNSSTPPHHHQQPQHFVRLQNHHVDRLLSCAGGVHAFLDVFTACHGCLQGVPWAFMVLSWHRHGLPWKCHRHGDTKEPLTFHRRTRASTNCHGSDMAMAWTSMAWPCVFVAPPVMACHEYFYEVDVNMSDGVAIEDHMG